MTPSQDQLRSIEAAMARLDQTLEALRQIPKIGEEGIPVDGIEHELHGLAQRLRSLRDAVAGEDDRPE